MSENQEASVPDAAPPPPTSTESTSSDKEPVITSANIPVIKPQDSSRPSSLPKPSGLKLPSKIGRLCSNAAPKPAIPISPRSDGGSSDTIRKLSDDFSRKHLSDLLEAEEDEVSSTLPDRSRIQRKASTCSTFSMNSIDALWEKYPRRLSEAGLRRSSDHSVVLTEDTDSFIIGERVWVGGTKPGQIAYIGETQFAPGDWAGIVLDEPIGKNDGSVAGVRYFQCSEKRGVFSRLTRLTRTPLISHGVHDSSPTSDAGSVFERPPSGLARSRRALSPNGSIRSVVSSKMNASISTTTGGELRLGDRVIVSSSRGSKAGILRYVGLTDFATGVWAGVELDDPLGKNDGSVDGKRYFECMPRFGLFAPISKVSRSPSNRKPGSCAIHNNGRTTPLRRSNSRESLTSLGTSIASSRIAGPPGSRLGAQRVGAPRATSTPVSAKNALQELLREKQHHVERLMRERELERAETAKITLQAERAENALAFVKKQTTEVNEENVKLKSHVDQLNKLLEDERQKVEDLMFRNEEENINKEDYNKYRESMEKEKAVQEQRIRELSAEAELQRQRAETAAAALLAAEERRCADLAASAAQHNDELTAAQTLSSELQKLLDEAYALLKEKENEKDSIGKSMSEELSRHKIESEKALNEAKTKLAIAQTEFETQQSVLTAKLQLLESKLEAEKQGLDRFNKENSQVIIDLNTKLTQLQAALDDKTLELNKITGSSKEHEVNFTKEITKLKMELSAKVLDVEQMEESKKKQESTCKSLQEELSRLKEEFSNKINEYETLLSEASEQNENSKTIIFELQKNLSTKEKELEKLLNDSSSANSSTEQLINEYKEKINERDKEVTKLKSDFEQATVDFNMKHSKIAEEHKKEIDEKNTKIDELTKEIQTHKDMLDKGKVDLEALNSQYLVNLEELKTLKEENERLVKSVNELTLTNSGLKDKLSSMELEIGELTRQLNSLNEKCNELQNAKEKMESEYLNLTGQTSDSNEQFVKLSQHLKETEKELQDLREKHRETTNDYGRIEQELKQKMLKLNEDFELERTKLAKSLNEHIDKLKDAEEKILKSEDKAAELLKSVNEITVNNDKLLDENTILKQEIQSLRTKELDSNTEFESIRKKLEIDIDRYREEIALLKAEGATSEVKLMEKVDQLTEAQNDLNNKLEEARKHEDSLQKVITDMTAQLNHQKTDYEAQIVQINNQLSKISGESENYQAEALRLQGLLDEKLNNIKDLTLKLEMLEVDVKSNLEIVTEKDRQKAEANEEYNKVISLKNELEHKLNEALLENTSLKQKHENLIASSVAEESLLKNQEEKLDVLKKEIMVMTHEKSVLEETCHKSVIELNQLKLECEDLNKKLKEIINLNEEMKKSLDDVNNTLKSEHDKHEADSNKIKLLEKAVVTLKQEVAEKETLVKNKETELVKLNNNLQLGSTETQNLIKSLHDENKHITEKHKSETETLNNTLKLLQNQILEKDNLIQDLQKSTDKVTELQEQLAKSEQDIKQLSNINEGQKSNYEDLNRQLQLQYDEFKKESKRIKHDLKVKIVDYEKVLEETKKQNSADVEKQILLQQKLTETENKVVELSNQLELAAVHQNATEVKDDKLEKLTLELQATRKSTADALANSDKQLNVLRTDVEHKIKELKHKSELLDKLQEELKTYKAKLEISEREKLMLQKDLMARGKDKNDNNAMGILGQGDVVTESTEEKEIVEGQVSFLNSVIVDMQRKNEQLLARVQALEGSQQNEPQIFNGHKTKLVAPRLFCDICDIFDAHDTEDCPKQAQLDVDAPAQSPGANKPKAPPRPYCDICEVFGHSTENCDEEETF